MGNIRANRAFMIFFLALVASAVSLNTMSALISDWLNETFFPESHPLLGVLVAVVVLLFPAYFVMRFFANNAGKILGAEVTTVRADRQEPLPFLIMGYSPLTPVDDIMKELEALGAATVALPSAAFTDACTKKSHTAVKSNLWQQNLRSAWHHREKLIAIYVLNPDKNQFDEIKAYLNKALENVEIIQISDAKSKTPAPFVASDASGQIIPPAYEDYTYAYEGLRRGVKMVHARADAVKLSGQPATGFWARMFGGSDSDALDRLICIDATAGVKIFSVAAAALTLNRPLKFSYVTSGPTGGEMRFYDTNLKIAASSGG
jgi:hypothetical protein